MYTYFGTLCLILDSCSCILRRLYYAGSAVCNASVPYKNYTWHSMAPQQKLYWEQQNSTETQHNSYSEFCKDTCLGDTDRSVTRCRRTKTFVQCLLYNFINYIMKLRHFCYRARIALGRFTGGRQCNLCSRRGFVWAVFSKAVRAGYGIHSCASFWRAQSHSPGHSRTALRSWCLHEKLQNLI